MSMILYLKRADNSDIERLKIPDSEQLPAAEPTATPGFFSRLLGRSAPARPVAIEAGDPVQEFIFTNQGSGDLIDFDRAWDALNMMLTGEPFGSEGPLAIFYYKGEEIGPDAAYGPARYIPTEKMKEFATALHSLEDQDLASRFDPAGFEAAQLYSSYLFSEDGIEVDYIMQCIPDLRDFADKCAESNSGALVAIY